MTDSTQYFSAALAHHKAGRIGDAAALYERAIDHTPQHVGALFNLASVRAAEGRYDDALHFYDRVLALQPEDADTLCNLGNLCQSRGERERAEIYYRTAIEHHPTLALAHLNLGNLYFSGQRLDEAEASYRKAILLRPDLAQAQAGLGAVLWAQGKRDDAERATETSLALDPRNPDAHNNLGNILADRRSWDDAVVHYRAALALKPNWPNAYLNLGGALAKQGDVEGAVAAYRAALALAPEDSVAFSNLAALLTNERRFGEAAELLERYHAKMPDNAEIYYHLGNLEHANNRGEAAEKHFRRAIEIDPQHPEFYNNLANALQLQGRNEEAVGYLEQALARDPKFANAYNNLGNSYLALGDSAKAITTYKRAVELEPEMAVTLTNLGNAYRLRNELDEAAVWFKRTLEVDPKKKEALNGLGLIYQTQARHGEAIAEYEKAIAIDPLYPEALNNLAISYQDLGLNKEALACYQKVIDVDPERAEIYFNLGSLLQYLGRSDESVTAFYEALRRRPNYETVYPYLAHALMQQCSWTNLEAIVRRVLNQAAIDVAEGKRVSVSPFGLLSMPSKMQLSHAVARQVSAGIAARIEPVKPAVHFTYPTARGPKLKIGYVSPDFRFHSVAVAFRGLLEEHDRDRYEFHGIYTAPLGIDNMTRYFVSRLDSFHDVSRLPFVDAAKLINELGLHVLVDLAGHTRGTRLELFALRPAPVTAHYLGFSTTLGADFIDYLITDRQQIPPTEAEHCSEKLVYLPEIYMPTGERLIENRVYTRAEAGLPETGMVFANFNSHYKFYPTLFDVWMRVLRRTPGSVLWLIASTPAAMRNLRLEAERRGVDPARLIFAPRLGHGSHLARLRLVDFCFDCLHHGGGVTTTDALSVGVPVITLAGETTPSRNGASLLTAIGTPELITRSHDEYETLAFALVNDPAKLARLKAKLLANGKTWPLFDTKRLVRHLETAYELMWENYAAGRAPQPIKVPALPKA